MIRATFSRRRHEDAGALLGLPAQAAVALAEGNEGVAGLGYLHEGLDERGLAARVAAMLEGVEVALWERRHQGGGRPSCDGDPSDWQLAIGQDFRPRLLIPPPHLLLDGRH